MALFNSRKRSSSLEPAEMRSPAAEDERPLHAVAPPAGAAAPVVTPVSAPVASGLRIVGAPASAPSLLVEPSDFSDEASGHGDAAANDMRNLPLGTLLFRHGLVSQEELEEALTTGMATGERLGEILISRGRVSEEDIARLLAVQQGLPFLHEDEVPFDGEAAGLLPLDEARAMLALPVAYEDGAVVVATASPSAGQPDQLHQRLHRNVRAVVVTDSVFARLVERAGGSGAQSEEPQAEAGPVDLSFLNGDGSGPELAPTPESVEDTALAPYDAPAEASHTESAAVPDEEPVAEATPAWEHWADAQEEEAEPDSALLEQESPVADLPETEFGTEAPTDDAGHEAPEPESAEPFAATAEAADVAWYEQTEEPTPAEAEPLEPAAEALHDRPESAQELEPAWSEHAEPVEHVELHGAEHHEAETHEVAVAETDDGNEAAGPEAVDDGRIHELGTQHEASVGRIHDLLGQIEAGASTFSDLRRRLGELGDSLRVTEESLAEREQRLAELTHAHEDDQRRIEELVGQLRQRDDTLGELGGRVEDLTGRLVSAEERLDEREQRLARLDASLNESASRVEALFRQVELRDEALAGFADKLDALARQFGDE